MSRTIPSKETPLIRKQRKLCKCGGEGTYRQHPCPYDEDVKNDPTPKCNCCAACARECARDV